jgi:hypothetical protein
MDASLLPCPVNQRARRIASRVVIVVLVAATAMSMLGVMQPLVGIGEPPPVALGAPCPVPLALVNGGFEAPEIPDSRTTVPPGWTVLFGNHKYLVPQSDVPGWQTTATNGIFEMWENGAVEYDNPNTPVLPAAEGDQWVELNATQASELYQVLDTTTLQGQALTWHLSHRGRRGVDTMQLRIGPDGGTPNFTQQ